VALLDLDQPRIRAGDNRSGMPMEAILPLKGRDLRLDLFRGLANWVIFIAHIPNNVVTLFVLGTGRYGFSDGADMFVFISGYTVAFVYARVMIERGTVVTATRIIRRTWQIYVAHVFLFVVYLVEIGYFGQKFGDAEFAARFNVQIFLDHPAEVLYEGLILKFKPVNMDVLPLYIVLMLASPIMLRGLLRHRNLTLLGSIALYFAARQFGWNLPSYPAGSWYFNPFAWQLLYVSGAWFAVGGAVGLMPLIRSRALLGFGVAYLAFAFVMAMAGRHPDIAQLFPSWFVGVFNPNDKTNLAPYRFLHFVVIAFLVVRIMPRDWPGLEWRIFKPAILCGQQSLEVFCVGTFLSFAGHFVLVEVSDAVWMQVFVSVVGITLLTLVAWYRSWSKRMDKAPRQAASLNLAQHEIEPLRAVTSSRSPRPT
jgi:hypothetical protein